jgi:metallophosphoesterase superfamily enzyme
MKVPCFYQSPQQLILPAFGAFTGLHILSPKKGDQVFVTTGKEVVEITENRT